MNQLTTYLQDGANHQARATLMYLQSWEGIEESWSTEREQYLAIPEVARWENCREQGYIISLRSQNYQRQLNIAFFEHRNSDSICAVLWQQLSINALTIDTAQFGSIYKNKYDVSHSVVHGNACQMAEWIYSQLIAFWITTQKEVANEKR